MRANGPLLVTGFEPFDGHGINVSWEVANRLHGTSIGPTHWLAVRLACRFGACIDELTEAIERFTPCAILCLGQAEGRDAVSVERVAINVRDARIADNAGYQPLNEPVVADGPFAYPSRLPVQALVSRLRAEGHRIALSNTAGTFVCNDLFYGLMHRTQQNPVPAGFIHLPVLPEQVRDASQRSEARDDAPITGTRTPSLALAEQIVTINKLGALLFDP